MVLLSCRRLRAFAALQLAQGLGEIQVLQKDSVKSLALSIREMDHQLSELSVLVLPGDVSLQKKRRGSGIICLFSKSRGKKKVPGF